jgi:hypothetical protein
VVTGIGLTTQIRAIVGAGAKGVWAGILALGYDRTGLFRATDLLATLR